MTPAEVRAHRASAPTARVPRGTVPPRVRPKEPPHSARLRISMTSDRACASRNGRGATSRRPTARARPSTPTRCRFWPRSWAAAPPAGSTASSWWRRASPTRVGAGYDPSEYDLAEFSLYGSPREGTTVEALEAAVDAEIKTACCETGVTAEEVARAKTSLQSSSIYARDSLRTAPNVIGRALDDRRHRSPTSRPGPSASRRSRSIRSMRRPCGVRGSAFDDLHLAAGQEGRVSVHENPVRPD